MFYQNHIQLKTPEMLDADTAKQWYQTVKSFGPENITYSYQMGENFIAMEYGTCEDCEFQHAYVVPLVRDLTETEAAFIVQAWEYLYDGDFDVELSSNYDAGMLGNDGVELSVDEETRAQAVAEMSKWNHNRWVDSMVNEGWRHGPYFSNTGKTHPALRSWDMLPESHRRSPSFTDAEVIQWVMRNKS